MSVELAQQILDGKWRDVIAAREAAKRGAWAAFVHENGLKAPPLFGGRGDYKRCRELAERSLVGPETLTLSIVPLWACSTEDAESDEWVAIHGVIEAPQPLSIREVGPFYEGTSPRTDQLLDCTVRRWTASLVVLSKHYAPDIELELRAGTFAVSSIAMYEVVSVKARAAEPVPRPTRMLPMFAAWYEPRVTVEPALVAEIQAMSFTADDEGDD